VGTTQTRVGATLETTDRAYEIEGSTCPRNDYNRLPKAPEGSRKEMAGPVGPATISLLKEVSKFGGVRIAKVSNARTTGF